MKPTEDAGRKLVARCFDEVERLIQEARRDVLLRRYEDASGLLRTALDEVDLLEQHVINLPKLPKVTS